MARLIAHFNQLPSHQRIDGMAEGIGAASSAAAQLRVGKPVLAFATSSLGIVPTLRLADDDAEQLPLGTGEDWQHLVDQGVGKESAGHPKNTLLGGGCRSWIR